MISEVAKRYAQALFDLTKGNGIQERVFNELKALRQIFGSEKEIQYFFTSPLVSESNRVEVIRSVFSGKTTNEILNLLVLLAEKGRLSILSEIVDAYEFIADEAHGVSRGTVTSAMPLGPDERKKIEETVTGVTKRKVILGFNEDPSLLGGLVAQVGGWTFDDSLKSHLVRMSEELHRRTH